MRKKGEKYFVILKNSVTFVGERGKDCTAFKINQVSHFMNYDSRTSLRFR